MSEKEKTKGSLTGAPVFAITNPVDFQFTVAVKTIETVGSKKLRKEPMILNKGTKPIPANMNRFEVLIPVATQETMKSFYEIGPEFVEHVHVVTRNGYKSAWELAAEQ